ncbi:MAG: pilus assembly PilX N-terminal domain-containing protein [bacterium]|nr:pilus assembly PilX N-terminal domain-containing protein [bacterium]
MLKKDKQGIVLVTTMLCVVMVTMLLSTVVYSNIGSMRLSSNFYGHEGALMAAQSGVQYAINRLQSDITWHGEPTESTGNAPSLDNGLSVYEAEGNVVGEIISGDHKSFFRIKFNYEDGDDGFDGLKNSSKKYIPSPYVSVNNLYNSTPTHIYTASGTGNDDVGKLKTADISGSSGETRHRAIDSESKLITGQPLDKSTCALLVEGFDGNGVQSWTKDKVLTLDVTKLDSGAEVSHRVVETYLTFGSTPNMTDAVACAAGNLKVVGGKTFIKNAQGSGVPKIRGLRDVDLKYNEISFPNGEIHYGQTWQVNGASVLSGNDFTAKSDQATANFTPIRWDSVPKASGSDTAKLKAGTYVWSREYQENKNGKKKYYNVLRHYSAVYTPQSPYASSTTDSLQGVDKSSCDLEIGSCNDQKEVTIDGVTFNPKNASIIIDKDVKVVEANSINDLVIRADGSSGVARPQVFFKSKKSERAPIFTSDFNNGGSIYIQGATLGNGSITSCGSVYLQGPSILESDPGVGVSVYSKGDVNLLPITSYSQEVMDAYSFENSDIEVCKGLGVAINNTQVNKAVSTIFEQANGVSSTLFENTLNGENPREFAVKFIAEMINNPSAYKKNGKFSDNYHFLRNVYCTINGLDPAEWDKYLFDDCKLCVGLLDQATNKVNGAIKNDKGKSLATLDLTDLNKLINGDGELSKPTEAGPEADLKTNLGKAQEFVDPELASDNFRDNKSVQLLESQTRFGSLKYSDQDISGVLYAWGNINIDIGQANNLNLNGTMIAYGGDPTGVPGTAFGTGNINVNASQASMIRDTSYMNLLQYNSRRYLRPILFSCF